MYECILLIVLLLTTSVFSQDIVNHYPGKGSKEGKQYRLFCDKVSFRGQPSVKSKEISTLEIGATIEII